MQMNGRHWQRFIGGVTALALLGAACAPAAAPAGAPAAKNGAAAKPSTPAELAVYTGADRLQILEAGAKAEGTVTWYTSLAGEIVDRLAEGFKQKYPGMQVDIFRGAENEIVTRANQEAQAGRQVFDVVESPFTASVLLREAGLTTRFTSPSLKNIPDEFKAGLKDGQVDSATVRMSFISFAYNTNLIPDSAAPKTYQDLMNPVFTSKLALAGSTTGKRWTGSVLEGMGQEKGTQWLEQFAAQQQPAVQNVSGRALLDLVVKGEVPASPTIFRDHLELMQQDNPSTPAKWVALEPVTANVGQVVYAAKAPHPYAGMLYIDYLLNEGQQVLRDNSYTTADQKQPFKIWIPENGKSTQAIETDVKAWDALFAKLFLRKS